MNLSHQWIGWSNSHKWSIKYNMFTDVKCAIIQFPANSTNETKINSNLLFNRFSSQPCDSNTIITKHVIWIDCWNAMKIFESWFLSGAFFFWPFGFFSIIMRVTNDAKTKKKKLFYWPTNLVDKWCENHKTVSISFSHSTRWFFFSFILCVCDAKSVFLFFAQHVW